MSDNMKIILFCIAGFLCVTSSASPIGSAQQTKRPFTVADEIELATFGDPYAGRMEAVQFSPDGKYFAIATERGRLDTNRVEDSLRFYRSQDVENFLEHSGESQPPPPVWVVNRSDKEGSIINDWRWLADSSGVAFLNRTARGTERLVLADLRSKDIERLAAETDNIEAFDVRDRQNYIYTAPEPSEWQKSQEKKSAQHETPAIVGTGRSLWQLLFPDDTQIASFFSGRRCLWAVVGGKRSMVKRNGVPLVLDGEFALSPDGASLVTMLPVAEVAQVWETLYPPPYASSPDNRIHAGRQDVKQYVRINLQTNAVEALTGAPTADDGGWLWGGHGPNWSSDGREILLPGTFIKSTDNAPSRPCVAVVDLPSNTSTCVEMLKGRTETAVENGYHTILGAQFVGGDKERVAVSFRDYFDESHRATEYKRSADGTWQVDGQFKEGVTEHDGLTITVKQGINDPPLLVATKKGASRVIWDPNPQLKAFELEEASVYNWKDKEGRDWRGGLYKPVNYKRGRCYPLVLQTHGFSESVFSPSGVYPTAFAARALAAAGIMVLQVATRCPMLTPDEGPCAVSAYESAAKQLISDGLADPQRIGIIGFSRTCFYVMETLTTASLHLKAASITDGTMKDYFQYMLQPERESKEANSMIGASPFGLGLQQWLKRSPAFNLDKITAPLLVVGAGPVGVLPMWAPYAGLRYLQKPVDLVMLNMGNGGLPYEHVLTNPALRMASQGGTVDWFRFWLQDYEDPDQAKAEQYKRWRELRKLQEENDKSR